MFQPFLRFYAVRKSFETLKDDVNEFQPFLRFYGKNSNPKHPGLRGGGVSTLLEILPYSSISSMRAYVVYVSTLLEILPGSQSSPASPIQD